jgi:two-component system, NtrC family, sensor kinase
VKLAKAEEGLDLGQPLVIAAALLLVGAVFVADLFLHVGIAVWLFYILPCLIVAWSSGRQTTRLLAALCTALILVGLVVSPGDPLMELALIDRILEASISAILVLLGQVLSATDMLWGISLVNRLLGIAILWIMVGLVGRARSAQGALKESHAQLQAQAVRLAADAERLKRTDQELRQSRAELEVRVVERTAALSAANTALEAAVLQHQQAEESARRRSEKLSALYAVTAAASVRDPETLLQRVLALVLPVLGSTMGWVALPGPTPEAPGRIAAAYGLSGDFLAFEAGQPLASCPVCASMLHSDAEPGGAQEVAECPRLPASLAGIALPESHASVPLRAGDRLLGVLKIGWQVAPDYTAEDRALLSAIGRQVGVALENAQLYQEEREHFQQLQQSQIKLLQSEKLAFMGRLAGSLAHEINNPLQAIQSHLELSLDYPVSPQEREHYLRLALHEILRLSEVTQRVLGMYRPARSEWAVVCLSDLVERTVQLSNRLAQRAHVQIVMDLTGRARVRVSGDQMIQVFLNLIINAIESIGDTGHVWITEKLEGNQALLTFANDGPPIAEEHWPRLFEPFFTTKPEGTGLGLAISRELIEQFGGSLTVVNLPGGQGVAFEARLPLAQEDAPAKE